MSSVLSRTSSLFSMDMVNFKDVKLDAPVSRMIASACSRSASQDIPTPQCHQSFLFNIFTHFDIPGSSPSIVVLISSFDSNSFLIQTRSTGSPRNRLRAQDISIFPGDDRTEWVKPYQLRNRVWPSFLKLSFANFERRPWSHTCSCEALHTCCCPRLSSSPPHTALRISRVALEPRRRLERRRTPTMLSFWDHSWCVQSVPAVPQLAELQQTTLGCLILGTVWLSASISRAFVNATPSCFQVRLACPSPRIDQEALHRTRAFCRNTPSQAVWLPCNHPVLD